MKAIKHLFFAALTLAVFSAAAWAQTSDAASPPPKKKHKPVAAVPVVPPASAADVQALKDAIAAQQQQIQQLTLQLQQAQQNWQQTQATATAATNQAAAAQTQASQEQQAVVELKSDVVDLRSNYVSTTQTLQETQKAVTELQSPLTIRYKGINITPGGFAEAAFVRRSRALGADLPTPFNSLTMPGASQSSLSEFFGSGRQSRPTVFIEGRLKNVELTSYISADFLSAGVTSTATQTNSYTLRLRQAWAQAKFDNGWKFLGGQMWSLVTEGKAGIAPSDDLGKVNDARPMTIDPGYNAGFTFARQYGIRLTKDFGDKFSAAVSMENAEGTLTTHNNGNNFLLGEAGASNSYNTTGNYTFNPSPDIIAKIAFDPGFGHYEIFGLYDRFRGRVFPCGEVSPTLTTDCGTPPVISGIGAYNASTNGGGFGVNARWNFFNKRIVFGLHGFGGNGVGRYGAAQLSDITINPNGTIHMLRNGQGLATLEWHGKKLDVYGYSGVDYAGRAWQQDPLTLKYVGYGSPYFPNYGCYTETAPTVNTGFTPGALANCTGDTRAVIEGTAGFWYRFYNGPKGKFQFGTQYSYVTRQTWGGATAATTTPPVASVPGALTPEGLDGMVFTSFRYYLP
jgi:hypothetical protein